MMKEHHSHKRYRPCSFIQQKAHTDISTPGPPHMGEYVTSHNQANVNWRHITRQGGAAKLTIFVSIVKDLSVSR